MNKNLDLAIIDAIKSIIAIADAEVVYTIHKGVDQANVFKKKGREIVSVNITLTKDIEK